MDKTLELKQKRGDHIDSARAIVDTAEAEDRGLTEKEEEEFNKELRAADDLARKIFRLEKKENPEARKAPTSDHHSLEEIEEHARQSSGPVVAHDVDPTLEGMNSTPRREDTDAVRVYTRGSLDKMLEHRRRGYRAAVRNMAGVEPEELSFSRALRGLITGEWDGAEAERSILSTSDAAGGYLIPAPLSDQVIKMALARSGVMRAGASTVTMDSKTLDIPKITRVPEGEWKPENEAASHSDMEFDQVTLTAKTLFCPVRMSLELAQDGKNVNSIVERSLAEALSGELDRAALLGEGGENTEDDPLGVDNTDGVLVYDVDGELTSYDSFVHAYWMIKDGNEIVRALIANTKVFRQMDGLRVSGDGQPLKPPESWGLYDHIDTNKIPIEAGEPDSTTAFIGDWRQVIIGTRQTLRIEASMEAEDYWLKGQVGIRAYLRADVVVARPAALLKMTNIEIPDGWPEATPQND